MFAVLSLFSVRAPVLTVGRCLRRVAGVSALGTLVFLVSAPFPGVPSLATDAAVHQVAAPTVRPVPRPAYLKKYARYRDVVQAVDAGNWHQAREKAKKLNDPLFANYIDWLDYKRPGAGHSFADITGFIERHPDWPGLNILRIRAEEAVRGAPSARSLLDWFERYPPLSAAGLMRQADSFLQVGAAEKGREVVRRAWREADFGRRQEHQFIRRHHDLWTLEDNIARLDRLLWEGKIAPARRIMGRVNDGQEALAEARRRLRAYRGGVDRAIKRVPAELVDHPGLLYERLRWRRRKHRDAGAVEILDQAPAEVPYPELWWVERDTLARRALDSGQEKTAYRLASGHKQPPGTVGFAEGEWLSGWIALRFLDKARDALGHFEAMYENSRFPLSRSRAAYWAGRALDRLDRPQDALAWYRLAAYHPTTLYGQLATLVLGRNLSFEHLIAPSYDRESAEAKPPMAQLVRLLTQVGYSERITPFIDQLYAQASSPDEKAQVVRLARDSGRFDLAVEHARDALKSGINLLDYAYPLPVDFEISGYLEALIMSIIRQESGFRSGAQSHAGARGLMQVIPATAKAMAKRLGLPYSPVRLKRDPHYNIALGRVYIESLIERYDGSLILALAAYNAGPARVEKWIRRNGDPRLETIDPLDWIEKIPFRETRHYVQRVLSNLQVYRARLSPQGTRLLLAQDLHLAP